MRADDLIQEMSGIDSAFLGHDDVGCRLLKSPSLRCPGSSCIRLAGGSEVYWIGASSSMAGDPQPID